MKEISPELQLILIKYILHADISDLDIALLCKGVVGKEDLLSYGDSCYDNERAINLKNIIVKLLY